MTATKRTKLAGACLLCLIALFVIHSMSVAQIPEVFRTDRLRSVNEALTLGPSGSTPVLEAPVDPLHYRLVPGDQLLVGVWGDRPETHRTVVTPDGHLVVPNLLAVDVRGLTLAEGAAKVRATLAPLYPREPIELHLLALGDFRVTVAGAVARPGLYETNGAERLSDLIAAAGGLRAEASLRRIFLRSRNGELANLGSEGAADAAPRGAEVDLAPWYLEGDLGSNPHLRPGDIVEIPTRDSWVEIGGAIGGAPGLYLEETAAPRIEPNRPEEPKRVRVEWMAGDRVSDVLALAGGLGKATNGRGFLVDGDGSVDPIDLFDPTDLSRPVQAFMRIEVEQAERWVYVVGAVRAPGRYAYYPGLAPRDYVHLAGGETENGRSSGWKLVDRDGQLTDAMTATVLEPGATLRVPERRSYWLGRILSPLSSAAALGISILILTNRR